MTSNCGNFDSSAGWDAYGLGSGSRSKAGVKILSGNPSIGEFEPDITFYLYRQGSPSGTNNLTLEVYQGSTLVGTGSSMTATDVDATGYVAYAFSTPDDYTIAANDKIVLSLTGGSSSAQINVKTSSLAAYDSSYKQQGTDYSPWADKLVNTWWCYGDETPTTTTLLPPPPAFVRF